jgi:hypothetical protein
MRFDELTTAQKIAAEEFVSALVNAIYGPHDRRGLLMLYVSDRLRSRDQHYTGALFEQIAERYGYAE